MRWGLTAIGLAWLAAGCSPAGDPSPFAESRTPSQLAERFHPPEGWAWGYLAIGDGPDQRYGVGAPASVPAAQILILPGYGESAEDWFETVRDLNRRGFTVWLLEGVGQGGSGRLTRTRDLGHVESFDADVAAVRAMARTIIRPAPHTPLILLGQGIGATLALRALAGGLPASGLVLSQPALAESRAPRGVDLALPRRFGLGAWRAPGAWRAAPSGQRPGGDPWRQAAAARWRRINPDLRMGGPSFAWLLADRDNTVLARRSMTAISAPVVVLASRGVAAELERDAIRGPWLEAIDAFVRARIAEARGSEGAFQAGTGPIASAVAKRARSRPSREP